MFPCSSLRRVPAAWTCLKPLDSKTLIRAMLFPLLARRCLVRRARKNRFLHMADADPDEERGARNIAGLECLHDVVTSVRGALGKLWAHAGDRAAGLDLQRNSRQHFDERGISRLLGYTFAKFAIAHA